MNQKWFVARQKKKLGPFTADDLQALAAAKEIQPADMVLQEGATQWAPARSLPWLFPVDIPMATLAPLLAEPESVQAQAGKEREADSDANATQTWAVGASTSAGTRFRILRAHAKGGLGQVYVAHDEEVHREVALKEILEKHADNPESRARFLLEAEITGGLEHPGIVPVYGLGTYADGRPFYAMRFIRGATLKDAIAGFHKAGETENENRTVAFRKLLGRFIDACNAIGYAHSRGVLHRDLKPGNIMLGKYGETLVVDWGLAKSMAHAERTGVTEEQTLRPASGSGIAETLAGSAIGTPAYMSPEQALGRLDLLGPATDVYSLGATLYCLLTGHAPFADKDVPTVLRKVQKGEFLRPRQTNPEVPAPLEAICLKAMALEAGQRYASPRALADDIEHWLADEPVSAYREPGLVKAGRWARKHKPLVSGAAAALLVSLFALAAGAIWLESHRAETARTQTLAQTENVRKRALAEEKIRQGLDQAATSRAAFHGVLKKTGGVHELLNQPARWEAQIKTARADWQRAKDLADQTEGNLDPQLTRLLGELDSKLAVDRADYDLAMRLEAIRLDLLGKTTALMNADGEKEPLRGYREVAQREYPRAFHDAGLAIEPGLQKNLAERIHQSAIREQLLSALEDWAYVAYRRVNPALATRILEVARLADPDPWRDQVRDPANWQKTQTMKRLADQVQDQQAMLARLPPQTLSLMFLLLPKEDELSWLRRAQAAYPTDFWINFHLGVTLMSNKERALEATGFYRVAIAVRPNTPGVYANLGIALSHANDLDAACDAYKRALSLDPKNAPAWNNLGNALDRQGDLPSAIDAYRKSLALDPNFVMAWSNLGVSLRKNKQVPAAIEAYKKALAIDPSYGTAWSNLGVTMGNYNDLPGGIEAIEKALAINPNHRTAQKNLDQALQQLEAKVARAAPGDPAAVALQLAQAEVLRRYKKRNRAAAELFVKAFAVDPKQADDLAKNHRYNAARAASRAAVGQGVDADQLDAQEKARLRKQAFDWLQADLTARASLLKINPVQVHEDMRGWQRNADFAGLRDKKELAQMPAEERDAFTKLWSEIDRLVKETRSSYAPTEHKGRLSALEREQSYPIKMTAGKTYVIDMESTQFDTYLRLEDDKGNAVAENDDINYPDNLNSRIVFTAPADGAYRIVATSYEQNGIGVYTIAPREVTPKKK